jgi:hypothetical protein
MTLMNQLTTSHLSLLTLGDQRYALALYALACLALSPMAQAVSPAPDGGYPGGRHEGRFEKHRLHQVRHLRRSSDCC